MHAWEKLSDAAHAHTVREAHKLAKRAQRGKITALGEVARIVFNTSKVLSHMYASIWWCLTWPAALQHMMKVFDFLGLELLSEAPCIMRGFDYYFALPLVALAPVLVCTLVVTGCIMWAACSPPTYSLHGPDSGDARWETRRQIGPAHHWPC